MKTNRKKEKSIKFMKRLAKNKLAIVGMIIIILLLIAAFGAEWIAPYDPNYQDTTAIFQKPGGTHILGTDNLGRDMLSRLIYGTRLSLKMGVFSVALAALLGVTFGSIAGYYGGIVDDILMRFLDIYQSVPGLVFCVALAAALGPGLENAILAVGITTMTGYARMIRASIMQIKNEEYIEAATAINARDIRILIKHILPNAISPVVVQVTMGIGGAILLSSTLSFIGLGVQPPAAEWGCMLAGGRSYMREYGYLVLEPGIAIMISVLSFNLLGDGLRDALDPRLRS